MTADVLSVFFFSVWLTLWTVEQEAKSTRKGMSFFILQFFDELAGRVYNGLALCDQIIDDGNIWIVAAYKEADNE